MKDPNILRIATRESPLALWQAEHVKARLEGSHDGLRIELVPMTTEGDQLLDRPLIAEGGKGLFIKELEVALLEGRADIAVHSMKDVPPAFPPGLTLQAIMQREDPRDAFVSNTTNSLDELPNAAVVGTASLRRQCQLSAQRPDLEIRLLRGNVGTRLRKLDAGDYDAIILACAGLRRLQLEERIRQAIPSEAMLPAAGQGAIGIECRTDDPETQALIVTLNCPQTSACVTAERSFSGALGGNCRTPIAAFAEFAGDQIHLRGLVATPDGKTVLTGEATGTDATATETGAGLAAELSERGALDILAACGV